MNHTLPDNPARYPSLVGKTVLITGGGSGIGSAMSVLFASQDCSVVVLDIDDAASRALVGGLCDDGRRAAYFHCDVTDIDALQRTIRTVESAHGAIDVLVNNAARDDRQDLLTASVEYWDRAIAVNVRHHVFAAQAVVPGMQRNGGGSIINMGSVSWMRGRPGWWDLDVESGDPWPDAHARARAWRDEHPRQLARSGCDSDRAPA